MQQLSYDEAYPEPLCLVLDILVIVIIRINFIVDFHNLAFATFDPIWQSSESAAFCRKILQLYLTKKGRGPP